MRAPRPREMRPLVLEEDRYVVLLCCGHWTQTRRPDDPLFVCIAHGDSFEPARNMAGEPAVLEGWSIHQ